MYTVHGSLYAIKHFFLQNIKLLFCSAINITVNSVYIGKQKICSARYIFIAINNLTIKFWLAGDPTSSLPHSPHKFKS